jgi:hypothetical protein
MIDTVAEGIREGDFDVLVLEFLSLILVFKPLRGQN